MAIEYVVASGILQRLCGFPGYPRATDPQQLPPGLGRFIEVLAESSVNVAHANAVIESFDQQFPTVREIRETALSMRAKYEVSEDQRKEWEAQYGPAAPVKLDFTPKTDRLIDRIQKGIIDCLRAEGMLAKKDWQCPTDRWWAIAEELGFDLSNLPGYEIPAKEAKQWRKDHPGQNAIKVRPPSQLPTPQRITQADVDAAVAARQPGDGE